MPKISFPQKIYFSIFILVFIIIINCVYSFIINNKTEEYSQETAQYWLPSVNSAKNLKIEISHLRQLDLKSTHYLNKENISETVKMGKNKINTINSLIDSYSSLVNDEEEKKLFTEFKQNWQLYLDKRTNFSTYITNKNFDEGYYFLNKSLEPKIENIIVILDKINELNYNGSVLSTQKGNYLTRVTNIYIAIMLSLSCFIMFAIIILVKKSSNKIEKTISDLKFQSVSTSNLGNNLNNTSNELHRSTENQSASVHKTSAAINQISSMINRTSENTKSSLQIAINTTEKTKKGEDIMNHLEKAMETIEESSQQLQNIGEIIKQISGKTAVINDIVSKTELLSLNASIESARAGEHGKGFAVVAEEVGNLAKVSGKSANEIQQLIQASQTQVNSIISLTKARINEGKSVTAEAHSAFKAIAENILNVKNVMEQISDASKEQEIGIQQISSSMTEIDNSTEELKKIVTTTDQFAKNLVEQSQALDVNANILQHLFKGEANKKI